MYFDESAWVAIGFALFIILVWKKAGAALVGMLDGRADKISAELDEAKQLRKDAARELEKFEGLRKKAEAEAKTIIANALTAADRIREDAEARAKVHPFVDFCEHHEAKEVPDPYYGGSSGFELVADLIEDGCQGVLTHIAKQLS